MNKHTVSTMGTTAVLFGILLLTLGGCAPKPQAEPVVTDKHTSMNALDVTGCYAPEGRKAKGLKFVALGKENAFTLRTAKGKKHQGTFRWEASGRTIRLVQQEKEVAHLFVGEGFVRLEGEGPGAGERLLLQPDATMCR
ncbi:hypothetical protein [Desulfovibrio cuneatus]|uniref:hypothetical protein n=1 Tax=Desulfovibrio cuneatus TaxID=159728 RepID=UPI00041B94F9|nr:hypothetical protein [Desulfovibrio cuneatus]